MCPHGSRSSLRPRYQNTPAVRITIDQPTGMEKAAVTPVSAEDGQQRYSVFTTVEKWCIVAIVAYAAWFSTLSSFIYYPALASLAQTFDVSVAKINLTVTTYMAVATIAPTLVGDAADVIGRR